jgi:hypothetical protein
MAKAAQRITAEAAALMVQSGMWLDYGAVLGQPDVFDAALAKRLGQVTNLRIRSCLSTRARAVLDGRLSPSLDDVLALAEPVLRHRMALNFAARAEGAKLADVIAALKADLG